MLYIDKRPVTGGKFPNKETYVDFDELQGLDPRAPHELTCKFESNDDLVNLMLYKKSLYDAGFTDVGLFLPYLPYAALDRTEDKRCLGAKHVGAFLNGLHFSYVRSWEVHSNVALATAWWPTAWPWRISSACSRTTGPRRVTSPCGRYGP